MTDGRGAAPPPRQPGFGIPVLDRRRFLALAAATGGALALGACARGDGPAAPPTPDAPFSLPAPAGPPPGPGDLAPTPRPVVRQGFFDANYPNPFGYLPFGYGLVTHIYDTLLLRDSTGALLPWLASHYEPAAGGLVHRFELRPGVTWHDGRPLTGDDVVFSFEYFAARKAEGKVAPWVLFGPTDVARVRAIGARGVEITLERPAVTFTSSVAARFPIVPRHVWSSVAEPDRVQDLGMFVGTGPYRLEQYGFGQGYLFTANDRFFLGPPFVRRLEYVPAGDSTAALRAGKIDAATLEGKPGVTKELRRFAADPAFSLLEDRPDFAIALYWNPAKGGALDDVRFRRACALAIDRDDMVARALGGVGVAGNPGFLPPGHPFHVDVEQYRFNRTAANRLLDEAGYRRRGEGPRRGPDGRPLRFTLATPPQLHAAVELVVNSLKAVGVELKVRIVDQVVAIGDDYEMALLFYGGVASEDPDYLRRVYSSRVEKPFMAARGYANPELDDLADRQMVTADEAQRRALLARMQEIVATDLPLLHLYYSGSWLVFRKAVFDGWVNAREADAGGGPLGKQALVTGVATGGTIIRPTS